MNKLSKLGLFVLTLLCSYALHSQEALELTNDISTPMQSCGFDGLHQKRLIDDPTYLQNTIDLENFVSNYNPETKVGSTPYRIPVVVHVMEAGNSLTEITDAQIREAIKQLNERFRKIPGTPGDGAGVDAELEFALAVRDPSGNCTNGIVRYDMTGNATYMASGVFSSSAGITDASLKALSFWNSFDYYNIWLVSEIDNNNGGSGTQGYAYFASAHGQSYDGTVILASNFKNSSSTTGTHELGHAFNLYHTFEGDGGGGSCPTNTNCTTQGDRVCDTPPHSRSSSDCNETGTNVCDGGSSNSLFVHNYMDYSSDACQSEFTAGQKVRVAAAMTGIRTSFLESNGNMSLIPPSTPIAAFEASASYLCSGNSVQFTDLSGCTPNTFLDSTYWTGITFDWTFTSGANVYNSTLQNPLMTFPVAGVYDVSLSITNGFGTATDSELGFVVVGAGPVGACTPGTNNAGNFAQTVNNVSFNTINNGTSSFTNVAYTDFSCTANTVVTEGATHQMNIDLRAGGSGAEVVEVYIDYDNSGTFDAGELVLSGSVAASTAGTISGPVTIPTTAVKGSLLRMRVFGETGTISNNERNCISNTFIGDVEDYGVYIMSACVTPIISVSNSTNPSACGILDGSITINGTGNGDVTWTGTANGSASNVSLPYTITGLGAGSYDIQYGTSSCVSSLVNSSISDPGTPTIPVITASGPLVFCDGGSVTLNSSEATGNSWSTSENSQSIVVNSTGTYSVTYTDAGGCSGASLPILVTVNPIPVAPAITSNGLTTICSGGSVELTSSSPTGNSWSTSETAQTITVSAAGDYTVQYTDGNGCLSLTSAITAVSISSSTLLPLVEGFSNTTFVPANWTSVDAGGAANWARSGTIGNAPTAGNSMFFNNYNTDESGFDDEVRIMPLDFQGSTGVEMSFDVAYARYSAGNFDGLEILVSTDCGNSFTSVYLKSNLVLATDTETTGYYTPSTWRNEVIDLSAYDGMSSVIVSFKNLAGYGNNIYVDNINISGVTICAEPDLAVLTATPAVICEGNTTTLNISGNLNDATSWNIYTGSCGGTLLGSTTNSSFDVNPVDANTTYYIRGEGGCSTPGACSSVSVAVNPIYNETATASICQGDNYIFGSQVLTLAGTFNETFTSENGCDSIVVLTLTVNPIYNETATASICQGNNYVFGTQTLTTAGTFTELFSSSQGCDSTVTLTLSVITAFNETATASICQGSSYIFGTQTLTIAGPYTELFTSQGGCDSTVVLTLSINPTYNEIATASICQGESYIFGTQTLTSGGTFSETFLTINGCDSTVALTLSINPSFNETASASICPGDTYIFGTQTLIAAGIYTETFTTADGCDSIVELSLSINTIFNETATASICPGDSYVFGTQTLTAAGTFTENFLSASGCDSTVALTITINSIYNETATRSICGGGSYIFGTQTLTTAGIYTEVFNSVSGCDSTVTLTLSLTASFNETASATICGNETFLFGTQTLTAGGIYTEMFTSAGGCDSTVVLTLSSSAEYNETVVASICQGSTYIFGSQSLTSAGVFTETFTSVGGCDSIVEITLSIDPVYNEATAVSICQGSTYIFGSQTLTASGTFTELFTSINGCDSTVILTLNVTTSFNEVTSDRICENETYQFGTQILATTGNYTEVFTSVGGCDSIVVLSLSVNPTYNESLVETICQGQTFVLGSQNLSSTGSYTELFSSMNGCDSSVTVSLTVINSFNELANVTICENETYLFGSQTINTSGTYTEVFTSTGGCDSTVTLTLNVNTANATAEAAYICEGNSYTYPDGSIGTITEAHTSNLTTINGCDSLIVTALTVYPVFSSNVSAEICSGGSYVFPDGTVGSTSQTQTSVLTSVSGCDSIVITDLVVNTSSSSNEFSTICEGNTYTFPDGSIGTTSQVYTSVIPNTEGCDSIIVTTLTVNSTSNETVNVTICEGDTYIFPDGSSSSVTQTQTSDLLNSTGCDSIITTILTVQTIDVSVTNGGETLTANQLGATYQWIDCADNNTPIFGETGVSFTSTASVGNYAVQVTVGACTETSDCILIDKSGIGEFSSQNVSIYPNPATNNITVIWNGEVEFIEITDTKGKVLKRISQVSGTEVSVNLTSFDQGVYFVHVGNEKNRVVKSIIKQ